MANGGMWDFYVGAAPRLYSSGPAYDLLTAGGETRRQGSLPGGMMRLPFRLSPDGKKLAVLVSRRSVAGGEDLVRNDLLVLDVGTGEQRMFEDFVRIYDPAEHLPNVRRPVGLVGRSPVSHLEEESAIRILDLATWQASEVSLPNVERGAWNAFSWSPDGRLWIGGPFAVETAAPNPTRDLALTGTFNA